MNQTILMTVAVAVMLGALGQVTASVTRIPAIVFLLVLGMAAGPFGTGLIEPANLGVGLRVLTSIFVAIILFEGGLSLRPKILAGTMLPVRRLISAGAAITFVGASVLAHYTVGLPWATAFIFGALVIVTGPTVIAPILKRIRLRPRLHTVLKSESILIDAVGVIVAVVVLEYVVAREPHWQDTMRGFLGRISVGVLAGALGGGLAVLGARFPLFHRKENEHLVPLSAVGVALLTFAGAESFYAETGVLAVTVAGLIMAAAPIPFRQELEKFKDQLGTLGVSVLFILLSANLNLAAFYEAGWGEVLLLAGMIFVIRPLSVFLSTWRTVLDTREKLYISLLAPRGIVAAAMASHFAQRLADNGIAHADRVEALVFLVIGATVFIEGAWAGPVAKLLRVTARRPSGVLLVGINSWSLKVAEILRDQGVTAVGMIDTNDSRCAIAEARGITTYRLDATEPDSYEQIDLTAYGQFVAMTANDAVNTLACETAAPLFGEEHTSQVMSKAAATDHRSTVRMAGRWAMPATLDHGQVCTMIDQGQLQATTLQVSAEELAKFCSGPESPMVIPVLIHSGDAYHIATNGQRTATPLQSLTVLAPAPVDILPGQRLAPQ